MTPPPGRGYSHRKGGTLILDLTVALNRVSFYGIKLCDGVSFSDKDYATG